MAGGRGFVVVVFINCTEPNRFYRRQLQATGYSAPPKLGPVNPVLDMYYPRQLQSLKSFLSIFVAVKAVQGIE